MVRTNEKQWWCFLFFLFLFFCAGARASHVNRFCIQFGTYFSLPRGEFVSSIPDEEVVTKKKFERS